jgi:proteic killer suppression protein
MLKHVEITRFAKKQISRLPRHIVENLAAWIDDIEDRGLEEVRKLPGYHDEPLHGDRWGQRSIRLNRSYRAIYVVLRNEKMQFISIEEVSKHDY